jgi:hypothetical protein
VADGGTGMVIAFDYEMEIEWGLKSVEVEIEPDNQILFKTG